MRQGKLQAALALVIWVSLPNVAGATKTEIFGGPGGGHFTMTCGSGRFLAGFHARAGGWIDGIGLVCAAYDAATGKLGARSRKGYAGGHGGSEQESYCKKGEAVTGLYVVHTRGGGLPRQYVNTIDIDCQNRHDPALCISSGEDCGPIMKVSNGKVYPDPDYKYDTLVCPSDELAIGVQGRSGIYIDAIGVICRPKPEPPKNSRKEIYEKLNDARQAERERGKRERIERIIQQRRQ